MSGDLSLDALNQAKRKQERLDLLMTRDEQREQRLAKMMDALHESPEYKAWLKELVIKLITDVESTMVEVNHIQSELAKCDERIDALGPTLRPSFTVIDPLTVAPTWGPDGKLIEVRQKMADGTVEVHKA